MMYETDPFSAPLADDVHYAHVLHECVTLVDGITVLCIVLVHIQRE